MLDYTLSHGKGTFFMDDPEKTSYLYFPLANEAGVMSSITPDLNGDSKTGQNTFLLEPVSAENLHNNKSSRNFWCYVEGKGAWSATGKSSHQQAAIFSEQKEKTTLEAGILYHKITRESTHYGIRSEITSFVPASGENLELMRVTLKNISSTDLQIRPTVAIPIYGRSADNLRDHRHVTALLHRIDTLSSGVAVKPTFTFDERGHQVNHLTYGVFGGLDTEKPVGFYPVAEIFRGEGGSFENPLAVVSTDVPMTVAGTSVDGYEAMGGICFSECILKPEEEKSYFVALGYGDSKESLEQTAAKFLTASGFESARQSTVDYWDHKINLHYSTGSLDFDSWMHWVHFQPILRRIYGCSFLPHHDYGRGGRGWRDLWQDCLALLIMDPANVRSMMVDYFAGVRFDGTNATIIGSKPGEFIADRNRISRVWMDHGVWPLLTVNLYIQQTGDIEVLLENNAYFKDSQVCRGEEIDSLWRGEEGSQQKTLGGDIYRGSILEHLLVQHLTAFYDVGQHNHMRLRGADWNDAMDMAEKNGESVAFTAMYSGNLEILAEFLEILEQRGFSQVSLPEELWILLSPTQESYDLAKDKQQILHDFCQACQHTISGVKTNYSCLFLIHNLRQKSSWLKENIRQKEWLDNGEGASFFNGYYDNSGQPMEGLQATDKSMRMILTSQVFPIMTAVASSEQVMEITRAADIYLYNPDVGGYRINTNFHQVKLDAGRMFGFAYGHKENGAVFSHMAVMYANALYKRGFVPEGYKVISSLYSHNRNFSKSRIYPGIPEYTDASGRGMYHYLTGAASWLLLTMLTEVFGIKGQMGNLLLHPKLMLAQFDENHQVSVNCLFAERELEIIIQNHKKLEYGQYAIGLVSVNSVLYPHIDCECIIPRSVIKSQSKDQKIQIIVKLVEKGGVL